MIHQLSLQTKAMIVGVVMVIGASAVSLSLYLDDVNKRIHRQYVEKARGVVMHADSVREATLANLDLGLFSPEQLSEWRGAGVQDKLQAVDPVLAAWRVAQIKADEEAYEFRVLSPQVSAPFSTPDEFETRVLEQFKSEGLDEYYEIDPALNAVRYFLPIAYSDPAAALSPDGRFDGAFEVIQSLDEADQIFAATRWSTLGIASALTLVSSLMIVWLARWVVNRILLKPLRNLSQMAAAIAQKDLTCRVKINSDDEIGQLSQGFNDAVDSLAELVRSTSTAASTLATFSSNMCASTAQLLQDTEQTSQQAATAAAATEEVSVNMANVADSSDQMTTNIASVATAVEDMTTNISDISSKAEHAAGVTNNAAQLVESSNDTISQLGSAADEIGQVVATIQDIAEQTNLLALNATIEAARAGDAGKGFAVVATEVKELARQTADATEGIRQRVERIQSSTGSAIRSLADINEVVTQVKEVSRTIATAVQEQSSTTQDIARTTSQTSEAAQLVSGNVNQSAVATGEITENIAAIDNTARGTTAWTGKIRQASADLFGLVSSLIDTTLEYKTRNCGFDVVPIKLAHNRWKLMLADMLAGENEINPEQIKDHTTCAFGKWYLGEGAERFGHLPAFAEIDLHHKSVHEICREICTLYYEGEAQEASRKLAQLPDMSARLFELLDQLAEQANAESQNAMATC